ncbi:MAG: helix-turn-helix domain-containing protein [Prevotella sp.]|nr:helix-turn-helix domain-containing protein [Prevotella sp.]MCM1473868.1 helix-turn-helix domain-containing protein [Muribaculaceae bacterium]
MPITLKAARINCGLNQGEAAKQIGVCRATLMSWEKYRSFPKVIYLHAIEKAYNMKYDDIIFLPDDNALNVTSCDETVES